MKQIGLRLVRLVNIISFLLFRTIYYICIVIFPEFKQQSKLLEFELNNALAKYHNYDTRLIRATLSIEDKRFYYHFGHDIFSIARAIKYNLTQKRRQGASTIEQQLIRILINTREVSFKRKFNEIVLSTLINNKLSKTQVINIYLYCYIFSSEIKGVESLCRAEKYQFDNLSINEIYEIAARFKYPCVTKKNYIRYLKRVRTIESKNNCL